MPRPAKPPAPPEAARPVMLNLTVETETRLDYLCGRVAARQGGRPNRSAVVRALIYGEYDRERAREEDELRRRR